MKRRDIWVTSSRSSDFGRPSFFAESMRAAISSMAARVSSSREYGLPGFGFDIGGGWAPLFSDSDLVSGGGASTSMASVA